MHTITTRPRTISNSRKMLAKIGLTAFAAIGGAAALAAPANAAAPVETPHVAVWDSSSTVNSGGTVTVWGSVNHPSGSRINSLSTQLQEWTNKGWKTIQTQKLSAKGYNTFTVHPDQSRAYRIYFPGWTNHGKKVYNASASGKVGVTMKSAPVAAASGKAATAVAEAKKHLGRPYVFGAAGPSYFDCSGLTQYVFHKVGVNLPHSAAGQRNYGHAVSASAARAGDIVVFSEGGTWGHVGLYLGNGYMLDAPHTGAVVRIEKVWHDNVVYRRLV